MESLGTLPRRRRRPTMDKIKSAILQTYHKDSYMAHRRDWKLGHEGRYRRTLSPSRPPERREQPPQPATVGRSASCATPSRPAVAMATARLRQPASTGQLPASKDERRPASAIFSSELWTLGEWEQHSKPLDGEVPQDNSASGGTAPLSGLSRAGTSERQRGSNHASSGGEVPGSCQEAKDSRVQEASRCDNMRKNRLDANGNVEKESTLDCDSQAACQKHRCHQLSHESSTGNNSQAVSQAEDPRDVSPPSTAPDLASPSQESPFSPEASGTSRPPASLEPTGEGSLPVSEPSATSPPPATSPSAAPVHTEVSNNSGTAPTASSGLCTVTSVVERTQSAPSGETDADASSAVTPSQPPPPPTPRRKNASGALQPATVTSLVSELSSSSHAHMTNGRVSLPALRTGPQRPNGELHLERTRTRPSARDLLDPRRLPEAMEGRELHWNGVTSSCHGSADAGGGRLLPERRWSSLCMPYAEAGWRRRGTGSPARSPSPRPAAPTSPGLSPPQSPVHSPLSSPLAGLAHHSSVLEALDGLQDAEERRLKQAELCSQLVAELALLRDDQRALEEESAANAARGATVTARVVQLLRPSEAERYRVSIEQVGVITSLLLCLEGRLARTQAALDSLSDCTKEEEAQLASKREKLAAQLAEARQLEQGVRRRRLLVDSCLERYLSSDELDSYRTFVRTKARLIQDTREIEQRIRSGEEQLATLQCALSSA